MKVPIKYKSSDRYNAGTDVIYDDGSKLQYAPFIYAGVTAKDNGDGGGDDEEGEDTMIVHILEVAENTVLDKNWTEIKDALKAGKFVYIIREYGENEIEMCYISWLGIGEGDEYIVLLKHLGDTSADVAFAASSASDTLTLKDNA